MTAAPLLAVRELARSFSPDGPPVVDDVSLDLGRGEILALIGPSGCGKTTTLRMIAGFEAPDRGRILIEGRDVTGLAPERRGVGMVFQDYALFPHMTAAENVRFGARDPAAVARWLEMVGLAGLGDRFPEELSGGQQQRVALARSFAAEPGLILLDEPFSNLDAALRSVTRREIRALLKAAGTGILFVTHDQEEALSFADRVAVMRNGRVLQTGPAQEVYDAPADAFVAGFLGRTNLLRGAADGAHATTRFGRLALSRPATGDVVLSLRPERIGIRPLAAGEPADGWIVAAEFKGHDLTYWVRCGDVDLQVDAMHQARLTEGTGVRVIVDGLAVPFSGS